MSVSSALRAAVLAVSLVACGVGLPAVGPVEGMMVIVSNHGGDCQGQGCGDTIVIELDGTVRQAAPIESQLGTVPSGVRAALEAAIRTTDFDAIRAEDWEGQCADDLTGQVGYEFLTPVGMERVSTCRTEVNANHPLFAALDAALSSVGRRAP